MSDMWEHINKRSLLPEWPDVEELRGKLEELGWEDGRKYGLEEHMLLETIIHDKLFEEAFERINKHALEDLTPAERREVLDQVKGLLRNAAEEALLEYLKHGINITVKREKRTYALIDFENLENNTFVYAHELKFPGSPENSKPDYTLLVNGIPIAIIEVEPSTKVGSVYDGIDQILKYEQQSPDLFRFVQLGVSYADEKRFIPTYPNWRGETRTTPSQPWKTRKKIDGKTKWEEDIHHLLKPDVLLEIIKWFTFFREREGRKDKIIARYNQYTATKEALRRINEYLSGGDKNSGLIWHWQGSGKTYTMFFIANIFFENFFGRNPLIFFIIDRRDLQRQLLEFLRGLKAPKFKTYLKKIENIEELKNVITKIKRSEYERGVIARGIYITLIQKFRRKDFEDLLETLGREYLEHMRQNDPEKYEHIIEELRKIPLDERKIRLIELGGVEKREILLLIDEAHRSQYGLLASVMKNVFLNSARFAFTGTPVFKFERNTFQEFAYPPEEFYLDVYFIGDSIDDGFTLPLAYDVVQEGEPFLEGVKILLNDEDIKRYIEDWVDASENSEGSVADDVEIILDSDESPPEVGKPLITREDILRHLDHVKLFLINERRLEKLAEYIARRIESDTEGFKFKAMVVAANRRACVILKKFLDEKLLEIYGSKYGDEVKEWTEVVMTYKQNERYGEILSYKEELMMRKGKRDTDEINLAIQTDFKEKENPKILIVTDMLITGFDAPKLKVMYLDKPLYEHRLLQATARVNRPYEDETLKKRIGLIVDSVGLLKHFRESLRKYELIAEGDIVTDLEENLLTRIEERFEEFKNALKDTKETLKNLTVEEHKLGIDVDKLKEVIEMNKEIALKLIHGEVDRKLRTIALFWDNPEVQKVLNMMSEVIQQFKSLGAHKGKMHYYKDIQLITYIYGILLQHIKGLKVPPQFWDGLIELIHEKTLVEDFRQIISTRITNNELRDLLTKLREIKASELIPERTIADAYRMLRSLLLEELPQNPVYSEIRERIEKARRDWIDRNIDTITFVNIITSLIDYKLRYDKKVSEMTPEDKIIETIKTLIIQRYEIKEEPILRLENFKKTLLETLSSPRITNTHKRRIRTALMKDLFIELRDLDIEVSEIRRLAEEAVEE
ncbi:type I restriction endonuclease subunit R, partial [Candidatus Geothermarchaeota archaeon]